MLRIRNKFPHHCLNHPYVAIKGTAKEASEERDPEVCCKAHNEKRQYGTETARNQDRLPAYAIR